MLSNRSLPILIFITIIFLSSCTTRITDEDTATLTYQPYSKSEFALEYSHPILWSGKYVFNTNTTKKSVLSMNFYEISNQGNVVNQIDSKKLMIEDKGQLIIRLCRKPFDETAYYFQVALIKEYPSLVQKLKSDIFDIGPIFPMRAGKPMPVITLERNESSIQYFQALSVNADKLPDLANGLEEISAEIQHGLLLTVSIEKL